MVVRAHLEFEDRFVGLCLDDDDPLSRRMARYMSRARLLSALRAMTTRSAGAEGSPRTPSGEDLLRALVERGFVVPLGTASRRPDEPHWIRLRGGDGRSPNPYELASSVGSDSVVSDLSAMQFWGLNDFIATSHYVRLIRKRRSRPRPSSTPEPPSGDRKRIATPKLGTVRFVVDGVTYRSRELVEERAFGIREAATDERETIRVLVEERALLMSFGSPATHGGARGVVEAWEKAGDRLRSAVLTDYVARDRDPGLMARRVAAVAEHVGRPDIVAAMETSIDSNHALEAVRVVPLLAGTEGGRVHGRFKVAVPW